MRVDIRSFVEFEGEKFWYVAHPHEHGTGYSYSIQMSDEPGDVNHVDTTPGTVFLEEDICALRAYFNVLRKRGAADAE